MKPQQSNAEPRKNIAPIGFCSFSDSVLFSCFPFHYSDMIRQVKYTKGRGITWSIYKA
jgi:hypothetical protein